MLTEISLEEAQAIMTKDHPLHGTWLNEHGEGPISKQIEMAFAKAYPGEVNLSDDEELFRKLNEGK